MDILGHKTPDGGTLPPNVAVSTLKPDIAVVDKQKKTVDIFELTCPAEHKIETANRLKAQKYSHFETDIIHYKAPVIPFEVGSHTGYITRDNKTRLASLHRFARNQKCLRETFQL